MVALTSCMPCSFSAVGSPRSEAVSQLNDPIGFTVTVRWIPLVPAAYGTQVARPARTTSFGRGGDGSQLVPRVTPVLGDAPPRGQEPGGLTAARWGGSNSGPHVRGDLVVARSAARPAVPRYSSGPFVPAALPRLPPPRVPMCTADTQSRPVWHAGSRATQ
jgi:hypothetical protein